MEEDFGGYIPLIIIALLAGMQIWMRLRAYSAKGKSTSLLKEYLQPEQLNAPRLIVYFWSEYCGPCKGMAPMVEKIMEKSPNLVKLNQHQHMGLARDLGAQGVPAFVMFEKGSLTKVHLGAMSPGVIKKFLQILV